MENNYIHPTAIIGENVTLGEGNYIGAYCNITNAVIGDNNRFEAYVSIGTQAEHRDYMGNDKLVTKKVLIGDNNIIREFVTINAGTLNPTIIGYKNTLLRGSHIGHDTEIKNNCAISCNVMIGGHCYLMAGVNIGLNAVIHQFTKIGAYAMIGMGSVVTKNKLIFCGELWYGNPAKYQGINNVGLARNNITQEHLFELNKQYTKI
jgi:UDP-N-acetylglucosamine acyltransferase